MLRSFRVANHRSIRDEQELLLLPAYDKDRSVVSVAGIFGANASGKSNLLDALVFMQTAVRTSYRSWEPGTGVPRQPFRLDPAVAGNPSLFVVDLVLDGVRFTYGFTANSQQVLEEWLYTYPQSRRRIIFERDGSTIRLGSTIPDHRSRESTLSGLTRDNALLLSTAAHANQSEVMPVYDWFRASLTSIRASSTDHEWQRLVVRLSVESADRAPIIELIRAADLGITDIQLARTRVGDIREARQTDEEIEAWGHSLAEFTIADANGLIDGAKGRRAGARDRLARPQVLFLQGRHGVSLTIDEQSEGTRTWMAVLAPALAVLEQGSLLVIDEIDTSLHSRLTVRLVELFQDGRTNPRGAQLLFTTHDVSLLGTSFGRDVLARDQIWFVEKDPEGATTLFPLTDFHPRKGENTERRYLGGSYGAVPAVFSDSLVDAYLSIRRGLSDGPA